MTAALIIGACTLLVVLAVWASRFVKHPEQTAGDGDVPADSTSDRFYRSVDRPAGPDAEDPPTARPSASD